MRRKVIKDYANKVCEIFTGWRLAIQPDDIPRLLQLGSGELSADLLAGTVHADGVEIEPLGIVLEIRAWLLDRCELDDVSLNELRSAELVVKFVATERRRRGRKVRDLRFECASRIATSDRSYTGTSRKDEQWLGGLRGAPWLVTDRPPLVDGVGDGA